MYLFVFCVIYLLVIHLLCIYLLIIYCLLFIYLIIFQLCYLLFINYLFINYVLIIYLCLPTKKKYKKDTTKHQINKKQDKYKKRNIIQTSKNNKINQKQNKMITSWTN